jgi:hypothetical protein
MPTSWATNPFSSESIKNIITSMFFYIIIIIIIIKLTLLLKFVFLKN